MYFDPLLNPQKKSWRPDVLVTSKVLRQIKTEKEDDVECDKVNRQEKERRPFRFVPSEEEDGDDEREEEEETKNQKSSGAENGKLPSHLRRTSAVRDSDRSQGGSPRAGPSSDLGSDAQMRSHRKPRRKPRLPNKELSKELSKQLNQEIQKTEDRLAHQNGQTMKVEPGSDGEDYKPQNNGRTHLRDWLTPKRERNRSPRNKSLVSLTRTTPTTAIRPTPCCSPPKCVQMERHVIRPPPISPPPDRLPLDDGNNHVMHREVWMAVFGHLIHRDLCVCMQVCKTWNRWYVT